IFNHILDARVRDGSWNRVLPGELANLDGSGSVFAVDEVDATLDERCRTLDIHPTGSLWGEDAPLSDGRVSALETGVVAALPELPQGLERARAKAGHRALRARIMQPRLDDAGEGVEIGFELAAGVFATAVLREIVRYADSADARQFSSST
ncbi:MAG: tRNA pseudouridine(13) synthase TruD, partial [Woeseiaceae bacterium]|nr:tRNA pseudouridine(13) synthase TruD [Woeseiaceae bacterium]